MGELLLRKALACRERLAGLRAALPADPTAMLRDERLEAFVSFHLFLLVQDCIDLAVHLIAARGLGVPGSHREAFQTLARAGLLPPELASSMGAMSALRNRIAHSYGDLDPVRLAREAPEGLLVVERFLDALAAPLSKA